MGNEKTVMGGMGTETTQVLAILLSMQRGRELAESHPEIAQEWEKGATEEELGKKYCLGDSKCVAGNAIHHALKILFPDRMIRMAIARKHMQLGSIKAGRITAAQQVRNGTGFWSMSPEKWKMARLKGGRNGGKKNGKKNYLLGLGIAALTLEQRREHGKKIARLRGQVPYEDTEIDTEFGLLNEEQFITKLKMSNGLSWAEIRRQVNSTFGNNRSQEALRVSYNAKWRKKAIVSDK